jgi:hypothetical protein
MRWPSQHALNMALTACSQYGPTPTSVLVCTGGGIRASVLANTSIAEGAKEDALGPGVKLLWQVKVVCFSLCGRP